MKVSREWRPGSAFRTGHKSHFIHLQAGAVFRPIAVSSNHDEMIGKPWGTRLYSHTGHPFFLNEAWAGRFD